MMEFPINKAILFNRPFVLSQIPLKHVKLHNNSKCHFPYSLMYYSLCKICSWFIEKTSIPLEFSLESI